MSNQKSININWQVCLLCCLTAMFAIVPDVFAGGATGVNPIATALCGIIAQLTGTIGRAVGIIALLVLGFGIFMGKLSWQLALATALGITFIFSAGTIMTWIAPAASVSAASGC